MEHIYPGDDLQEHVLIGLTCPCEPTLMYGGLIIHNAFDHREIIEQAVAILNGDEEDFLHVCGNCSAELQEVRPGKYQCVYCKSEL